MKLDDIDQFLEGQKRYHAARLKQQQVATYKQEREREHYEIQKWARTTVRQAHTTASLVITTVGVLLVIIFTAVLYQESQSTEMSILQRKEAAIARGHKAMPTSLEEKLHAIGIREEKSAPPAKRLDPAWDVVLPEKSPLDLLEERLEKRKEEAQRQKEAANQTLQNTKAVKKYLDLRGTGQREPADALIYEMDSGLRVARWDALQGTGRYRSVPTRPIFHSNPTLHLLPGGDLLCVWFAKSGNFPTTWHKHRGPTNPTNVTLDKLAETQRCLDGRLTKQQRRAAKKDAVREVPKYDKEARADAVVQLSEQWGDSHGALDLACDPARAESLGADEEARPQEGGMRRLLKGQRRPHQGEALAEEARHEQTRGNVPVLQVMATMLRREGVGWDTPMPLWQVPDKPSVPPNGMAVPDGTLRLRNEGVQADRFSGVLVFEHSIDPRHSSDPFYQVYRDTLQASLAREHEHVEGAGPTPMGSQAAARAAGDGLDETTLQALQSQRLELETINLVVDAVSKDMLAAAGEAEATVRSVAGHVQAWTLRGVAGQGRLVWDDPSLFMPDRDVRVRHPVLSGALEAEVLVPIHYEPGGLTDLDTQYSAVRWFQIDQGAAEASGRLVKGVAQISFIGQQLVEPCIVRVLSAKGAESGGRQLLRGGAAMQGGRPPVLVALMRYRGGEVGLRRIHRSMSTDNGRTWSPPDATRLPNLDRAFQALALPSGRIAVVFVNSLRAERWGPVSIALSGDLGVTWPWVRDLDERFEPHEVYSDPALELAADQRHIHVVYLWQGQHLRHVTLTEDWIMGNWFSGATAGDFPTMT